MKVGSKYQNIDNHSYYIILLSLLQELIELFSWRVFPFYFLGFSIDENKSYMSCKHLFILDIECYVMLHWLYFRRITIELEKKVKRK
jgi:hypothetical protein